MSEIADGAMMVGSIDDASLVWPPASAGPLRFPTDHAMRIEVLSRAHLYIAMSPKLRRTVLNASMMHVRDGARMNT